MKNGTTSDQPRSPDPTAPQDASEPLGLVIAATYTADPLEAPLRFWLRELGLPHRVEIAPYNQLFQQLLDPSSEFGNDRGQINLALIRFEDYARFQPEGWDEPTIRKAADELADAFVAFASSSNTPTIVVVPPPSPKVAADPARAGFLAELEENLRSALAPHASLHAIGSRELATTEVDRSYDEAGDRVGHMPYVSRWNAALSTVVARRIHLIKTAPYKVVALDCDNTLWQGVVGEDGPHGVKLGPGMKALQEFVVAQQEAGMVVCLVSKNAEADVLEAFEQRTDFPLRRDHLVSWRVNWQPKSQSLVELAQELNLGLDSFIFLDDNPVECAEVRASLPQVLTLQVPTDDGMADFVRNVWAFDRLSVTEEDRKRTLMYKQNADRTRLEHQAGDIGSFLASLDMKIEIAPPTDEHLARVAQLTQRTNQFNFTTVRRSQAEIAQIDREGLECLRVEVSDRFGDYGLVGVMLYGAKGDTLGIDTFLLSCRVLGRGVEHRMLAELGRIAQEKGLAFVEARTVPTSKNEPARNFLNAVGSPYKSPSEDGAGEVYRIPTEEAAQVAYRPGSDAREQLEFARTGGKKAATEAPKPARDKSASYARIAAELHRAEAVLAASEAAMKTRRALAAPVVEPFTAVQRELVGLWKKILLLDQVGVRDAFTDLGGTSLQAAQLFVQVEAQFGIRLPMSAILDAPTIEQLAERIASASRGESRQSLRQLKPGLPGGPALILVHDGDGETLLYLNLARRLPEEVAVYGLEPFGNDRCPMLYTRIPEMAADFLARVREVCPTGPYLLGGLCAGGVIAFEMALQLRAEEQAVGFVALMDSADSRARTKPNLEAKRRWKRFVGSLGEKPRQASGAGDMPASTGGHGRSGVVVRLARKGSKVLRKIVGVISYETGVRARRRAVAAQIRTLETAGRAGSLKADFTGPSVRSVYEHAEKRYEPARKLDAPVVLFRAGREGGVYPGDEPLIQRMQDPLFGWGARLAGGPDALEVVDVPGGHGGILQEPQVEVVATYLEAAIERSSPVAAETCS